MTDIASISMNVNPEHAIEGIEPSADRLVRTELHGSHIHNQEYMRDCNINISVYREL